MIRITSIEIDGFILENQKVKLDFVDSNIVCIYGDNGSGKTTFLEVLSAIFSKDDRVLEKYKVKSINISYIIDEDLIQISKIEKNINKEKIKKEELEIKLQEKYQNLQITKQQEEATYLSRDIQQIENDIKEKNFIIGEHLNLIERFDS